MEVITQILKLVRHTLKLYPARSLLAVLLLILVGAVDTLGIISLIPVIEILSNSKEISRFTTIVNEWVQAIGLKESLSVYFVIFGMTIVFKSSIKYFSKKVLLTIQADFETHIGNEAFSNVLYSNGTYINKLHFGKLTNLLTTELDKVGDCLFFIYDYIAVLVRLAFYFSVLFTFSGTLVLIIALSSILPITPAFVLNKIIYRLSKKRITSAHVVADSIQQAIRGVFEIKTYSAEGIFSKDYLKKLSEFKNNHVRMLFHREMTNLILEPLGVVQIILILNLCLGYFHLTFSETLIVLFTLRNSLPLLAQLMNYKQVLISSAPSYVEIIELTKSSRLHRENHSGDPVDEFRNEIILDNVSFSYGMLEVLKGIKLKIQKGDSIAIVGASGSGKSTLVKILMGIIVPSQGKILIDGRDLNVINVSSWRKIIGYVPQEPVLLNETLSDNIMLGQEDSGDSSQLLNSIKESNLSSFVDALPQGLKTKIGPDGINVSVGQKQRLSFARAIYRNPQVIILDEPTSALDGESENFINETLQTLKADKTLVVIAHRLNTIKFCDLIYVIDDGSIVEHGSYNELIAYNKRFAAFVREQEKN